MEIILYQPQIPQNTGNIIRTCSVTGAKLTLVQPLGFSLSEKNLRRAGLDYHNEVEINLIDDLMKYLEDCKKNFYFFSSKVSRSYTEINYQNEDLLIFGSETFGLDDVFFERFPDHFVTIPMAQNARCLNLSNSVSIGLYEALRQENFCFSSQTLFSLKK